MATIAETRALLIRAPASRSLLGGMAVSSLGTGLTLPFLVVYLHVVRGLALPTAGLALASAELVGLVAGLAAGARVDRLGVGPTLLAGLLLEGIGAAALAGVTKFPEAVLVASIIGAAEGITWPALTSMLAVAIPERLRQRAHSTQFMLMNLEMGAGGLVSGSVVFLHNPHSFPMCYLADGASFLIFDLVLLLGIRSGVLPTRTAAPADRRDDAGGGSYRAVLADRTFSGLLLCSLGVVLFGYSQVEAGFSVFAIEVVRVSPRVVGAAFAANCFVIVATQGWITRVTEDRSRTGPIASGAVVGGVSWCLVGASALPHLGRRR